MLLIINLIALGCILFGSLCLVTGMAGLREWRNDARYLTYQGLGFILAGILVKVIT